MPPKHLEHFELSAECSVSVPKFHHRHFVSTYLTPLLTSTLFS
jgi:hypothetical protein